MSVRPLIIGEGRLRAKRAANLRAISAYSSFRCRRHTSSIRATISRYRGSTCFGILSRFCDLAGDKFTSFSRCPKGACGPSRVPSSIRVRLRLKPQAPGKTSLLKQATGAPFRGLGPVWRRALARRARGARRTSAAFRLRSFQLQLRPPARPTSHHAPGRGFHPLPPRNTARLIASGRT